MKENKKIIEGKARELDENKKPSFIRRHRGKLIAYAAGLVSSVVVMLIKGKVAKTTDTTVENDYDDYDDDNDNDFEEESEAQE